MNFVGLTAENGRKLLLTLAFIAAFTLLSRGLQALMRRLLAHHHNGRVRFWSQQGILVATTLLLLLAIVSIWFDDPQRLTTAMGLVTAGLAFALQRVVTAVAGYFVILRGSVFSVGDRIVMGGVRGDVIALGFIRTTIMEMGQLPITYTTDRARAEQILLAAAERHTVRLTELSEEALAELRRRYFVETAGLKPRVYLQLTDNWLQ